MQREVCSMQLRQSKVSKDLRHAVVERVGRIDPQLGIVGRLIRCRNAAELLDFSGARFGVQALHVSLLADLNRSINEDFYEPALRVQSSDPVSIGPIRRDKRRENDDASVLKQAADFSDSPYVLGAVLWGETKIPVEPESYVVAVENVRIDAPAQ